jgi:hypothetical protein
VVIAARSADKLQQLADDLGPERVLAVPTDVTNDDQVACLMHATVQRFGRVDVLISNAGFGVFDRIVDARLADLQEMIDVNVYGTVRSVQTFLPPMLARGSGQIVIVASLAGLIATERLGFYGASKFALVGLTRSLMLELRGTGVRCALICPGVARTGFQQRADDHKYARITRLTHCTTEQVAAAITRAVQRGTHGEVIVPRRLRPLAAAAGAFPGLTRLVLQLVS